MLTTIALISQKGGSGKTMIARSLAIAFERDGQATAIIDMDPQASAALWGKRRESAQPEVIPTVLPLLADVLKAAGESVEVVLIDTPPKSADVAMAAARAADIIIIPCRPQIDDIETLPATKQLLDVIGDKPTFVVLNSVPSNPARFEEAVATITGHPTAAFVVYPHSLGHRAAFGDSSVIGQTPQEYEPNGKASEEIEKLHKYVCDIVRKLRSEKNGKTKHTGSRRAQAAH